MTVNRHLWTLPISVALMSAAVLGSWLLDFDDQTQRAADEATVLAATRVRRAPGARPARPPSGGTTAPAAQAPAALGDPPYRVDPSAPDRTGPLLARWEAEQADARWAHFQSGMQSAVDAAIADAPTAGSRLISLECRTTLCRTEVELARPVALTFVELGARVQQDALLATATGLHHIEGTRAVIYTAPPGTPLDLDPAGAMR